MLHWIQNWLNGMSGYGIWQKGELTKQPCSFTKVQCHFIYLAFCQVLFLQYTVQMCWIVNQRTHFWIMKWHISYKIDKMELSLIAFVKMALDKTASWQNSIAPLLRCNVISSTCHFVKRCFFNSLYKHAELSTREPIFGIMKWHIYYIIDKTEHSLMAFYKMALDKMASWQNSIAPLLLSNLISSIWHFVKCCFFNSLYNHAILSTI